MKVAETERRWMERERQNKLEMEKWKEDVKQKLQQLEHVAIKQKDAVEQMENVLMQECVTRAAGEERV